MSAAKMFTSREIFDRRPCVSADVSLRSEREDVAPRLRTLAPTLVELRLQIDELTDERGFIEVQSTQVRRVMVETAPAVFLAGCTAWGCKGGGFEVSSGILAALGRRETEFVVHDSCIGHTRAASCRRRVRVRGFAAYSAS